MVMIDRAISAILGRRSSFAVVVSRGDFNYRHIMTMDKRVKIAELKARLVPYEEAREEISVRHPVRALRDVVLPPKPKRVIDVAAVVRELRQSER